tara:strand:- start:648 stop:821 length:174 start_codon:yes stop_codon:yes gene_type:complete
MKADDKEVVNQFTRAYNNMLGVLNSAQLKGIILSPMLTVDDRGDVVLHRVEVDYESK